MSDHPKAIIPPLILALPFVGDNENHHIYQLPDGKMLILSLRDVRDLREQSKAIVGANDTATAFIAQMRSVFENFIPSTPAVDPSRDEYADPAQTVKDALQRVDPLALPTAVPTLTGKPGAPIQPRVDPIAPPSTTPEADPQAEADEQAMERLGFKKKSDVPVSHTVNDPNSIDGSRMDKPAIAQLVGLWERGDASVKVQVIKRFLSVPFGGLRKMRGQIPLLLRVQIVQIATKGLPQGDKSAYIPSALAEFLSDALGEEDATRVNLEQLGQSNMHKPVEKAFVESDDDDSLLASLVPGPTGNSISDLTSLIMGRLKN